jgi:hypothetical protein
MVDDPSSERDFQPVIRFDANTESTQIVDECFNRFDHSLSRTRRQNDYLEWAQVAAAP